MFRYSLVWEKSHSTGFLNAWKMPLRAHEDLVIFYKKLPTYNPLLIDKPKKDIRPPTNDAKGAGCYGRYKLTADTEKCPIDKSMPKSVLRFNSSQGRSHPTQKPVPLMEYLIKTYTNENQTILDNCIGSGTTAIAALNTGRNFIGIEQDAVYFEAAVKRVNAHVVQKPLI
jgi:site-specific DNA-methyltransferase (adenine-specific)